MACQCNARCVCYPTYHLFLKLHCTAWCYSLHLLYNLQLVFEITLHLSTGSFNIELGAFSNKFTYCGSCPSDREGFYLSDFTGLPSIPSAIEGEQDAGYFVGRSLSVNPKMWKIQIFPISLSPTSFSPKQYILITKLKLWKTKKSF